MTKDIIRENMEKDKGILRMLPIFIPRRFSKAGHRLRLHPNDYYAFGTARGSIKERWFSSVIPAMNGDDAVADEGMSYVMVSDNRDDKILFKNFVDTLGAELIGSALHEKFGTWPMYSKFFDFKEPLFHHLHLSFQDAARVGKIGKPEAYFYPFQYNNYEGTFPHTYFGFSPDITKEEVKKRLEIYQGQDNRITEISRAYRIELGTGWYTAPGVLHAPGSYLTYEPQWNSDVNSVYENVTAEETYPISFLNENCPDDKRMDFDYLVDLMDWDENVRSDYRNKYFRPPVIASQSECHIEKWISYGNDYIAAKELTVYPGVTFISKDPNAYGCIFIQGHGKFGVHDAETPSMLRFGQMSQDEFFVGINAATSGVMIENLSKTEPIVILKHFPAYASQCPTDKGEYHQI